MIAAALVYNAALYSVQSLSLTVYSRQRAGMPLPCPLIACPSCAIESCKKRQQPFFLDV